jgi:hypothetical protein
MRASFHVFFGNAGATCNGSIDEISEAAGASATGTASGEAVVADSATGSVQCQRLTRADHWHASATGSGTVRHWQ